MEMPSSRAKRRRFGYRRIGLFLDHRPRQLYRLFREDGLSVKRRRGRKRASGTRTPMPRAAHPDAR